MKKQLLSASLALMAFSPVLRAQHSMVGLTSSNSIFTMANASSPSSISGPYSVSGVTSGQILVAMDYQPSTGKLYALGYDSAATMAQLYTITNSGTAYTANPVAPATPSIHLGSTTNASFDFISTLDNQIRIMGRNGNTYLLNTNNGSIVSTGTGATSFASTDVHGLAGNLITGTAYTNSFYGADATTQVGYDAVNNVLVSFDAASFANGFDNEHYTLHSMGLSTGAIISGSGSVGMDAIYDTATNANMIYMSASNALGTHLYSYNMATGSAGTMTDLGAIGSGSLSVKDIAFPVYRDSTSAITGHLITALSLNHRNMLFLDSDHPGNIRRMTRLAGVSAGQTMVAIDYSATGTLYGLGYNSVGHSYQLYTIDSATGNVTAVNTSAISLDLGSDDGSGVYVNVGFRFIPTDNNQIRVIGNNGTVNVRINAATGTIIATDAATQYVTGDANAGASANITSVAYTGYNGDATTQMFGFDANTGAMIKFNTGNGTMGYGNGSSGYINTDISLTTILSLLVHNTTYNNAHMNIAFDEAADANFGFMAANYYGDSSVQGNYSVLYDMNAAVSGYHKGTSATDPTPAGQIGCGTPVKDISMRRAYTGVGPSSVTNVSTTNDLTVYPNPVAASTRIVLPNTGIGTLYIDVVDMAGHIYHTSQDANGMSAVDFDMSTFAPGDYTLNVYGLDGIIHHVRVVKL